MDAGDLRVFAAVARHGGMNRAAAALNTVQSNVTAKVRALEEELGTALFERHSRGVSLTPAGERLLPYADRAAQLLEDARRAALDDGAPKGRLTVGSLETTAALRLAPVLSSFARTYPEVDLGLRTGTTRELIADVLERRVEGAFVCGPVEHSDLEVWSAFREPMAILAAPGLDSLAGALANGETRIVVLRAGCSYRQMLETVLAQRGIVASRVQEFGTLEAMFACVEAGLGITLLPRALIGPVLRRGRLSVHPAPGLAAEVETVFIQRKGVFASSALRAFVELACGNRRDLRPSPVQCAP